MTDRKKHALKEFLEGFFLGALLFLMMLIQYYFGGKNFWVSFLAGFLGMAIVLISSIAINDRLRIRHLKNRLRFLPSLLMYTLGFAPGIMLINVFLPEYNENHVNPLGSIFGLIGGVLLCWFFWSLPSSRHKLWK